MMCDERKQKTGYVIESLRWEQMREVKKAAGITKVMDGNQSLCVKS